MKVYKFGGTSVGLPERMKKISKILTRNEESKIVVLSAVAGTTNDLVKVNNFIKSEDTEKAVSIIEKLEKKYVSFISDLYDSPDFHALARMAYCLIAILLLRPGFHLSSSFLLCSTCLSFPHGTSARIRS